MIKKIILGLLALLLIGGGVFFFLNSKDTYDASKYQASGSIKKGEVIGFTLPDQFDKSHTLNNETKTLIFTFAKSTSHIVRDFLQAQPADYLSSRHAYYVADISPMPTVIRNAFAMPDLKKSNYPVLLIYDASIAAKFRDDSKQDSIMIVSLENKKVTDIQFVSDAQALQAALN
jgi:hypothetical protein